MGGPCTGSSWMPKSRWQSSGPSIPSSHEAGVGGSAFFHMSHVICTSCSWSTCRHPSLAAASGANKQVDRKVALLSRLAHAAEFRRLESGEEGGLVPCIRVHDKGGPERLPEDGPHHTGDARRRGRHQRAPPLARTAQRQGVETWVLGGAPGAVWLREVDCLRVDCLLVDGLRVDSLCKVNGRCRVRLCEVNDSVGTLALLDSVGRDTLAACFRAPSGRRRPSMQCAAGACLHPSSCCIASCARCIHRVTVVRAWQCTGHRSMDRSMDRSNRRLRNSARGALVGVWVAGNMDEQCSRNSGPIVTSLGDKFGGKFG